MARAAPSIQNTPALIETLPFHSMRTSTPRNASHSAIHASRVKRSRNTADAISAVMMGAVAMRIHPVAAVSVSEPLLKMNR